MSANLNSVTQVLGNVIGVVQIHLLSLFLRVVVIGLLLCAKSVGEHPHSEEETWSLLAS